MPVYLSAFLIGVAAGLRSMTAPAAVSWAAQRGLISVEDSPLAFLGKPTAAYVVTALAAGELVADKLPQTPSRKAPVPFAGRLLMGGVCGYAMGVSRNAAVEGVVAGVAGAVAGTLVGYEFRRQLVQATGGDDLPIAVLEDAIALTTAVVVVSNNR